MPWLWGKETRIAYRFDINFSFPIHSFRTELRGNGIGRNYFDIRRIFPCDVPKQLARLHNEAPEVCEMS